jgi:hypothetical protein
MTKVLETTVIEIEGMLEELRNKHSGWTQQQRQADTLLYALLEGCLDFYRLLKTDEDCFAAFKKLDVVKWNKRTKTATMVVKAVFGLKAKKGYAYAKALEAAFAADIGKADATTMTHWLNDNGGINGVIRRKSNTSAAQAARDYMINVGKNAKAYGYDDELAEFECDYIKAKCGNGDDFVMLCRYDKRRGKTVVKTISLLDKRVDDVYEDLGDDIMKSTDYLNYRQQAHKQQAAKAAVATKKVVAELSKITARVAEVEAVEEAA